MAFAETDENIFKQKEWRILRRPLSSSSSCASLSAESQSSGTGYSQGHAALSIPFNFRSKRKVEIQRDPTCSTPLPAPCQSRRLYPKSGREPISWKCFAPRL